ncbi:unnamed protein product [Lactuca saligna]|uniref:Uncharacterized protein n=1 Tax=Lactuca saligna TaxID=75948 RepID=A0AA35YXJ6_LACSI|nr:unnamed protein product [Lactuca saligna]
MKIRKKKKNKHIVESPKKGRKVKRKDDGIKAVEIRSQRKSNLVAKAKTSKKEYGSGMLKPIEISSNSKNKFEKKVWEKKLEKRMEKKMDKRHPEGLRRLNSRMSPTKMSLVAYCAIFDIEYNKVLTEKGSMSKALIEGMKKFPNSEILRERMTLMKMLFNDVGINEDAVVNESDGIDEDTDTNDDMLQKNAQHENFGQASRSNKSPVTPYGTKENVEDIGQHREGKEVAHEYVTPMGENNEAWGNINELSSSQFFKLPGVVDEVLDMMDKVSGDKKVTYVGDNNYGVDKSLKETINEETTFTAQSSRNLLTDLNESVVVKDRGNIEK